MPTVYHRDQTGAPTFVYSTSSSNAAHFNALKTVLKACLVTGYGAQAAAGWELIAEGDLHLVLRNGSHSGYVCLTRLSGSPNVVEVWLSETFDGVSGDVMTGVGLKSGTTVSSSVPHRSCIGLMAYSSARSSWYVVADDRTFIIHASGNQTNYTGSNNTDRLCLYVGEDSEGNMIALGGQQSTTASPDSGFSATRGFTTLRNPETGLLVDSGAIETYTPGLDLSNVSASLLLIGKLKEISMSRVYWYVGPTGFPAGYLRGVALPAQCSFYAIGTIAEALGVPAFSSRELNVPFDLGDNNHWFLGVGSFNTPVRFITDAPDFWGE